MTESQAKRLVARLRREGSHVAKLYPDYSGRGMYGEKTWGVVVGRHDIDFDKTKFRYDNLGFDMIIY